MPERLTSNRKVIGTKQLRKALKAGRVRTAYVAADAAPSSANRSLSSAVPPTLNSSKLQR